VAADEAVGGSCTGQSPFPIGRVAHSAVNRSIAAIGALNLRACATTTSADARAREDCASRREDREHQDRAAQERLSRALSLDQIRDTRAFLLASCKAIQLRAQGKNCAIPHVADYADYNPELVSEAYIAELNDLLQSPEDRRAHPLSGSIAGMLAGQKERVVSGQPPATRAQVDEIALRLQEDAQDQSA
jgi:hypothetical protein